MKKYRLIFIIVVLDVELTVSIDNSFKRAVLKGQPKTYSFLNDHVFKTKKTLKPFVPNCDELDILLIVSVFSYLIFLFFKNIYGITFRNEKLTMLIPLKYQLMLL